MSENVDGYGWGEWNANFRDWWRSYLNNKDYDGAQKNWAPPEHLSAVSEASKKKN